MELQKENYQKEILQDRNIARWANKKVEQEGKLIKKGTEKKDTYK